nr:hypothetical protein [uncultured Carboxylicivirga sp.]
MKTDIKLFNISLTDTFLLFVLMSLAITILLFIVSVFEGTPTLLYGKTPWFYQLLFPLLFSFSNNLANRKGKLTFSDVNNSQSLFEQIDSFLQQKHNRINVSDNEFRYTKRNVLARFFDFFLRENIRISTTNNQIVIYSKKHQFNQIEVHLQRTEAYS